MILHQYLDEVARKWLDKVAVQEAGGSSITYQELATLSDRLRDRLVQFGVRPGNRVGFCIGKLIDGIATIFGVPRPVLHTCPLTQSLRQSATATSWPIVMCRSLSSRNVSRELYSASFPIAARTPKCW